MHDINDETTPLTAELKQKADEALARVGRVSVERHIAEYIARLEKKVEQLKMALYNPAGYRNQTAPTECPLCGQGDLETELGEKRRELLDMEHEVELCPAISYHERKPAAGRCSSCGREQDHVGGTQETPFCPDAFHVFREAGGD